MIRRKIAAGAGGSEIHLVVLTIFEGRNGGKAHATKAFVIRKGNVSRNINDVDKNDKQMKDVILK